MARVLEDVALGVTLLLAPLSLVASERALVEVAGGQLIGRVVVTGRCAIGNRGRIEALLVGGFPDRGEVEKEENP